MNFTITPETERDIFTYLRSSNCCLSCCLRFTGTQSAECFRDYINNSKLCTFENDHDDKKPCVACLGILQRDIQEQTLTQIVDSTDLNEFDSSTFTCALSIPVSLSLREKFLLISLVQKFELSEDQLCNLKLRMQSIKDVWKIQVLPKIEAAIQKQAIAGSTPSPFLIDISYNFVDDEYDCKKFFEKYENAKYNGKKNQNNISSRNNIERVLNDISDEKFMNCFSLSSTVSKYVTIGKISFFHSGIFIGGRYTKLSRNLSQTPWFINGEKKMETSVQDLLCNCIVKYTNADSLKFQSSGREDVDVRTINDGRPFAVELINPKITKFSDEKLTEIVDEINNSTQLVKITTGLKLLSPTDLKRLKEGENTKTKFYRTLCIVRHQSKDTIDLEQFTDIKNLKIVQKTPIRVLHRRPLTPRSRVIHEIRARWLTAEEIKKVQTHCNELPSNDILNRLFIVDVKTQAGTYVKEFIHGDFGRTRPNICDILKAEVDIVALDVTGINIDWP